MILTLYISTAYTQILGNLVNKSKATNEKHMNNSIELSTNTTSVIDASLYLIQVRAAKFFEFLKCDGKISEKSLFILRVNFYVFFEIAVFNEDEI